MSARAGIALLPLALLACGGEATDAEDAPLPPIVREPGEPDRAIYYQILISFNGAMGGLGGDRTRREARALAHELKRRLVEGANFFELMHRWSDDRRPGAEAANGPYVAVNLGVEWQLREDRLPEIPRDKLERAVGDAVFGMGIGEARLVEHDPRTCRWGWHILHRVR